MTDQYWHLTSITNTNCAVRSDFEFPPRPQDNKLFLYSAGEILNDDFIVSVYNQIKFKIDMVFLFYKSPNSRADTAHIDLYSATQPGTCALNWAVNGAQGEMRWYDYEFDYQDIKYAANNRGEQFPYMLVDVAGWQHVDSVVIGSQAILVRTDRLHAIENSSQDRWTISCRSSRLVTMPWDQVISELSL